MTKRGPPYLPATRLTLEPLPMATPSLTETRVFVPMAMAFSSLAWHKCLLSLNYLLDIFTLFYIKYEGPLHILPYIATSPGIHRYYTT